MITLFSSHMPHVVCCLSLLQDFESNNELKTKAIAFLEEVMHDPELLTLERKVAANIIRYCFVQYDCGISMILYILQSLTFFSGL